MWLIKKHWCSRFLMKRKCKQWLSSIPPITTKRGIMSRIFYDFVHASWLKKSFIIRLLTQNIFSEINLRLKRFQNFTVSFENFQAFYQPVVCADSYKLHPTIYMCTYQATVSLKVASRQRRRKCTLKSYDRFTNS
jgi:hypothetical protein